MIRLPALYVITPTNSFKARLSSLDVDEDLVYLLSEIVVLSHKDSETNQDILEVKLLFLMNIRQEYLSEELYQQIFGEYSIKLETFDAWWTIDRYLEDESCWEIEERIELAIANLLAETGRQGVDLWIKKIQNKVSARKINNIA
ncbi:hypothetical protein [Roseofilum casamattae]|uniref:Uncharacterized protein n=1 Tax=Roseofilum casamattae BLCC-M143 TaxID=3022442 RepID=A0ABT7BZA6_9CYAN|nr:hypothetical protein [Roseofilum casamattae]MDJ1183799.1 hypothetical protein [Roseofilum casamattae BLCC-M143]